MKRLTTIFCCLAFMVSGIMMAVKATSGHDVGTQTVMAATVPYNTNCLPLDIQLDLDKRQKPDTVYIHDSIPVPTPKYVPVLKHKHTTDTIYKVFPMPGPLPSMSVLTNSVGREEQPKVLQLSSKQSCVILTVDGRVVYKTGNDIHSTEDLQ